jgi:hypothetical protein
MALGYKALCAEGKKTEPRKPAEVVEQTLGCTVLS